MGVSKDDFATIKRYQPYQLGRRSAQLHPFSLLTYLNNFDKHRIVHPSFATVAVGIPIPAQPPLRPLPGIRPILMGSPRFRFGMPNGPVYGWPIPLSPDGSAVTERRSRWLYLPKSDDPTEVLRVTKVIARGPDPIMEMNPAPTLEVAFGDRERPVTLWDLIDIRWSVSNLMGEFIDDIG